jgi:hypothetical protein
MTPNQPAAQLSLPTGWGDEGGLFDTAKEKIDYFNQNAVTPDQLLGSGQGVTQADINWMQQNGYMVGAPAAANYSGAIQNSIVDQNQGTAFTPGAVNQAGGQALPAAFNAQNFVEAGLPNNLVNQANTVSGAAPANVYGIANAAANTMASALPTTYSPTEFYNLLQANDATASEATTTGLKLLSETGYTPEQGVDLWNAAYGTNFTTDDYNRALINHGIVKAANPQLAVFGDSISSVVGYNDDTTADTSEGLNLAQYLGQDLKLTAANNAIGGQTSSDALNGTSIPFSGAEIPINYGTYGSYLTTNRPETAVLRFGAADAIRLNDPALSISNIEKMVQMAQANGTKPILVGVTPFAKQGDFTAGNITSGITDSMVQSADSINEGIKKLAEKYGVQFVDVRKVEVPKGGLLDGVHPNGAYGASLDRYIADQIKSGVKAPEKTAATAALTGSDSDALVGLKSSFGSQDGQAGILSGFKYAKDNNISEKDMEQALGKDAYNAYKTGFADYARTGIASVLADKKLSFDEARDQVKFSRDYGYDAQRLSELTGTDKKVFDSIFKTYDDTTNRIVDSVFGAEDVKTNDDKVIRALALQEKFGFTDDDLAKAADFTPDQVKSMLDPVRNFGTDLNKVLSNTDSTLAETKKVLEEGRKNGAINQLYGTKLEPLDAKIAEMEDRWKDFKDVEPMHAQRVFDQLGGQRKAIGDDRYYRGVFADPLTMSATLARKGIDTLADIGQKDKYEATPAEKRYFAPDGSRVDDLGDGTFGVVGAEGGYSSVIPKNQVKTEYGYTEQELREGPEGGYYESKFVPLSDKDVDKEGNYQKLMGKVAIDKDTGKEIADLDGQIAGQNSSGGFKKKWNTLNVQFTKDGVPVVTASSQRAGLGGLAQDLAPMISMALPFVLPGLGSALSGMLPGAGVAASGATAAISPTLLNQALTQGIISGGLTTLGGGQFEKGFLSGAVNPVINTGISSLLPAGMDPNISRAITNAGTGAVRGALQGGDFKDLLAGGIIEGAANYGLNTALGASGLTPQQLNFATGIAAPLLQGKKVNPATAFSTLVNAGQQMQRTR